LATSYHHFPIAEWTLSFRNIGSENTPIIANIQALDTKFTRKPGREYILNHHTGNPCTPTDYQPHQTLLKPKISKEISTSGGRSSNSDLPYFNLQWPEGKVIIAIGWRGQWSVKSDRDEGSELCVQAGQELTYFLLHPGEEVRSPLITMQFWDTDRLRVHHTIVCYDMRNPEQDFEELRQRYAEWCFVSPYSFRRLLSTDTIQFNKRCLDGLAV